MQAARQHIQEAKQLLRAVLSLAHTEGYLRLFLDEGAVMETLLRALVPHVREQALASYLQSILHAFAREREERGDRSPAPALASSPLIEPLSAHEQRVLCLLAAGRSNPEIARELIVSVIDQSGTFPGRDYGKLASAEAIDLAGIRLRWYDHWLKGIANGVEQDKPVRIFVMGIDEWREEDDWPLPATQFRPYYLHSHGQANTAAGDGVLAREFTGEESEDVYRYDPRDPVPTVGGGSLVPLSALDVNVGPRDQRQVETRADVLCYTTSPLPQPLEVTGPIELVLYVASSCFGWIRQALHHYLTK
jgi:putative CocE/NonD family hydrolase